MNMLPAISPPERRSPIAATTMAGVGRNSVSTTCALHTNCQSAPNSNNGATRPIQRMVLVPPILRCICVLPSGGNGLAAHGEPDLIADFVEGRRQNKFLTRTSAIEFDRKLLDDLARSSR